MAGITVFAGWARKVRYHSYFEDQVGKYSEITKFSEGFTAAVKYT